MRNYLIPGVLLALLSCQSRPSEQSANQAADTASSASANTTTTPDTLCFRQIMRRDTTTVRLVINGEQASGYLDNKPYEKDRAQGAFQGTVSGSRIQADWQRSGEGTTQPYALDMMLNGDTISWHEGERIEQNGKWVLKDPASGYTYALIKTNCPPASAQ